MQDMQLNDARKVASRIRVCDEVGQVSAKERYEMEDEDASQHEG